MADRRDRIACDHPNVLVKGEPYDVKTQCRKCWLRLNDPRYSEEETQPPVKKANKLREPVNYDPPFNPYKRWTSPPAEPRQSQQATTTQEGTKPAEQLRQTTTAQASTSTCIHLGEQKDVVKCPSCKGHVEVKVFACAIYGACTIAKKVDPLACCDHGRCPSFTPQPA